MKLKKSSNVILKDILHKELQFFKRMEYLKYIAKKNNIDEFWMFKIDFFNKNWQKIFIRLKELKCTIFSKVTKKFEPHILKDSPVYKALNGNKRIYQDYCNLKNPYGGGDIHNLDRFDIIMESLSASNYSDGLGIVINKNNEIIDGQHRAAYLLYKFGEEHIISVLKEI